MSDSNGSGKKGKYLYLVKADTSIHNGYDTYSEFVACADSEEQARNMHPDGILDDNDVSVNLKKGAFNYGWVRREELNKLTVTLIGTAIEQPIGVVIASFHAG
jgi:hypothetical protein